MEKGTAVRMRPGEKVCEQASSRIFGKKRSVRSLGSSMVFVCPRCKQEKVWRIFRLTVWRTFFFLPCLPREASYFHMCPVCGTGYGLTRREAKMLRKRRSPDGETGESAGGSWNG